MCGYSVPIVGMKVHFSENRRCDRCGLKLSQSRVNNIRIIFTTSPNHKRTCVCIRCYAITKIKRFKDQKLIPEDVKKTMQETYYQLTKVHPPSDFIIEPEPGAEPESTLDYECDTCGMRFNKNVGLSLHKTHIHKKKPMIIINNA